MITPLICFVLGGIILYHAVGAYGIQLVRKIPEGVQRRDVLFFFISYTMIAFALILGLPGYFGYLNAAILHLVRLALGITGSIFLSYQLLDVVSRP
jgi:hypothetical protein